MSQIIFLSIIHQLFSEMHLHQMLLSGSCRPLLGKAAGSERLPSPSACTALFLLLTLSPPPPPKHLNSEFWSFSLESLPFRHLSRLRLQICVPGVTKLVFAERQICTLKHLLGALCPPRIPPGLPIHERKVTERWSCTRRKPFPGSTFPRQWESSLSSVHYWT